MKTGNQNSYDIVGDETSSFLNYLSILSGPLVACINASFFCLIPIRNVIKEPAYWYEDIMARLVSGMPVFACQLVIRADYWSNFSFKKRWPTYLWMIGLAYVAQGLCVAGYYWLWTVHLGYFPPLPMNQHLVGTISVIAINVALYFR